MSNDPEPALAALLTLLSTQLGNVFPTISRRLRYWSQVNEQPALFLKHVATEDVWTGTVVQRTEVEAEIWVYQKCGPDEVPSSVLNGVVLQVRSVLAADGMGNPVMLRNASGVPVARYVRVEGRSEYFPGDIAGQAVAIIKLKLMLP